MSVDTDGATVTPGAQRHEDHAATRSMRGRHDLKNKGLWSPGRRLRSSFLSNIPETPAFPPSLTPPTVRRPPMAVELRLRNGRSLHFGQATCCLGADAGYIPACGSSMIWSGQLRSASRGLRCHGHAQGHAGPFAARDQDCPAPGSRRAVRSSAFRGRRGDRLKLLYWDGQGFCLYY